MPDAPAEISAIFAHASVTTLELPSRVPKVTSVGGSFLTSQIGAIGPPPPERARKGVTMTFGSASSRSSFGSALPRRQPHRLFVPLLALSALIVSPACISAASPGSNSAPPAKGSVKAQLRAAAAWSDLVGPGALSVSTDLAIPADDSGCTGQSSARGQKESYASSFPAYNANFRASAWAPGPSSLESQSKQFSAAGASSNTKRLAPPSNCLLFNQDIFSGARSNQRRPITSNATFDDSIPSPLSGSLTQTAPKSLTFAPAFDHKSRHSGEAALAAIPADVDIEQLGLSPQGMTVAREAQNHGVYLFDEGPAGVTIQSQPGEPEIRWGAGDSPTWHRDFSVIVSRLRRVTNYFHLPSLGGKAVKSANTPAFPN